MVIAASAARSFPIFRDFAVKIEGRGSTMWNRRHSRTPAHAVMQAKYGPQKNFRVFGPDENRSNRLQDAINRNRQEVGAETLPVGRGVAPTGRVMEVLSEHCARAGSKATCSLAATDSFNCSEAFIHINRLDGEPDAKWLKTHAEFPGASPALPH